MATEFITIENQHWYPSPTKKDIWYPSVTTILSCFPKGKGFEMYLANQQSYEASQEILKEAGKRGTIVHQATELLENGDMLLRENYTLEQWKMLESFVSWHKTYNPGIYAIEKSVVSDKLKTGGTIDRVYNIGGLRTLLDIKTSSAIHDNYWLQVSVYVKLWEEKEKDKIDQVAILRLGSRHKCGYEYQIHTREQIEEDFKAFKSIQNIWNYINPNAKPKIEVVPDTLSLEMNK